MYFISRVCQIFIVMVRHRLDQTMLPKVLCPSFLIRKFTFNNTNPDNVGIRIRNACIDLGPIFVKLGQMISIRSDLFDPSITSELRQLQDNVPPFKSERAIALIERTLGKPIIDLYQEFNPIPLASASVAQVHEATMFNGDSVVVKVIRPGIKRLIKKDILVLRKLVPIIAYLQSRIDRPTLHALIDEYEYTILEELNLTHEACHYSQMKHHFSNDHRLHIPEIYWSHTKNDVMTVEKANGIPIDQVTKYPNVNLKKLAHNGVSIFFTQVFEYRFFHADMHPGNVFIDIRDPHNPQYVAVDFGIIGILSPKDQYYLAENFLAFYHRDYTRIAQLHIESGWVHTETDIVKFEAAIRHVCEPIFSKTIEEISIAELMSRLIRVSKPFDLNIQPQLLLLQKTLFHVEALGRSLYPKLNLWDAANPFLESFMKKRISAKTGWKHLKHELPRLLIDLPKLPQRLQPQISQPQSVPKSQPYWPLFHGIILGIMMSHPSALTNPGIIYILSLVFIIMIAWKSLK